ncbi:MAG: orotidine-5'-phosphate decarboxylase [Candidatus Heimdallarchaeota archaeon]|nr:orotidine-5'-phosphate decarboxylase [Candidatus Heimdallarchaeota archaeon]
MTNSVPKFVEKYRKVSESKNSILCVGVDPAIPKQRRLNVMPDNNRISFMRRIIQEVSPYTSVIKINRQYIIGLPLEEIIELNKMIHSNGMLSIIDHKLSDIGSTNDSAIFWFKEEGFDAFTFSPFAGNIEEATISAHKHGLGIIVLTLMSNKEAIVQKIAVVEKKPLYQHIAEECKKYGSDACVIGATGNVTLENLELIKNSIDENMLLLVPGVGAQGGDANDIIRRFNRNLMINVGRSIIYSENPAEIAAQFQKQFNE